MAKRSVHFVEISKKKPHKNTNLNNTSTWWSFLVTPYSKRVNSAGLTPRMPRIETTTTDSTTEAEENLPSCKGELIGASSVEDIISELSCLLGMTTETLVYFLFVFKGCEELEELFSIRLRERLKRLESHNLLVENNENILTNMGLTENCESWVYIIERCSESDSPLGLVEWAILYLLHTIRYRFPSRNTYDKYPYQPSTVEVWFTHDMEGNSEDQHKTINVLNMGRKPKGDEPWPMLDGRDIPQGFEETEYKTFYHGTDHKSAVSIFEKGIDLTKGASKQDFSNGKGFYLNDKFGEAANWAFHRWHKKPAVVVFRVPNEVIDEFEKNSLRFVGGENHEDWERVVCEFRLGGPSKEMRKALRKVSFIDGPMASVTRRGATTKIRGTIEGSYQMCLHSVDIAEQFDNHVHATVFFSK